MNTGRESKYKLLTYVHFYIWMSSSLLYTERMPGEISLIRYFRQHLKYVLACFFFLIVRTLKKPSATSGFVFKDG